MGYYDEEEEREQAERDRIEDWRNVLRTESGRRVLHEIINEGHILDDWWSSSTGADRDLRRGIVILCQRIFRTIRTVCDDRKTLDLVLYGEENYGRNDRD